MWATGPRAITNCPQAMNGNAMATATLRGNAFIYRRCHRYQASDARRCQGVAKTLVATNSPGGCAAMSLSEPARAVFELRLVGKPGTAGIHKRLLRQHGFTVAQMVELVHAGLATVQAERVLAESTRARLFNHTLLRTPRGHDHPKPS